VEAQIAALEAPLEEQRKNILTSLKNEYDAALKRESLLATEYNQQAHVVSGQNGEMDRYGFLKREVDATRTLYDSMLQKMKEASIASALRASNIRVVDRADVPTAPYKPDVRQSTATGVLAGLFLGIVFAVYRERADRTLQDPGDAEYYLGVPELGVIPKGTIEETGTGARRLEADAPSPRIELMAFSEKNSLIAESFRTVLTSIMFSGEMSLRSRVLVITSASPKEGKTTVTCNLSTAIAEVQSSVLLIDADMRRPRLHTVFQVENGLGLSDLLASREPLRWSDIEPLVRDSGVPGLKLMTSGNSRHKATSLLYSPRLGELMELVRERFDTTVFDTPPMINIADARLMGRLADGLIMVVRSSQTSRDAAMMAKQRLGEDGSPLLGVILNGWNPEAPGYSHYRNYYEGYKHYYGPKSEQEPVAVQKSV
jgi:polysaccharide biosynthesis transport protein